LKVLFIGGTGNISASVSRLCIQKGIDLYLLNRGTRTAEIPHAQILRADIGKHEEVSKVLKGHRWDAVVDWIAYGEAEVERDIAYFGPTASQYVFISSASAYQKPLAHPIVTESTPLCNPFWEYSRNKIACEERLTRAYRDKGFPMTIVRPSLTYDTVIPLPIGGWTEYTAVDRMKKGQRVIVHGDGTSLWTVTHAEDFAKGFVGLLGHQQAIGQAFHITSDEILTWDQITSAVASAAGVEAKIVHIASDYIVKSDSSFLGTLIGDKATSVIFDNSKIKRYVPGFKATIPFSEGIKRTLKWFDADPSRKIVNRATNDLIDAILGKYEGG
jgi:nucleoside-diphosphate-sugar epimerase